MPSKLYELRVYRGDREVRTASRLLCALDLNDAERVDDVLRRHLLAVAERDCNRREQAHMYHLDVHETRGDYVDNRMKFQFTVPVAS